MLAPSRHALVPLSGMGYSSSPVIGGSSALFTAPSLQSSAACQPQRDTRRVSLRSWRHARSEIQTV